MASSSHRLDNNFLNDYRDEMTEQEEKVYYRAYKESEGFDMPHIPDVYEFGMIIPLNEETIAKDYQELQVYAEEAINHYNKENGTNFEFVKILKANGQGSCGIMYYLTFDVKPIGTTSEFPTTTFQAQVLSGIPPKDIEDLANMDVREIEEFKYIANTLLDRPMFVNHFCTSLAAEATSSINEGYSV